MTPALSRQLLVFIPPEHSPYLGSLPRWDGLSISVEVLQVADVRGRFLVLRHVMAGTEQVFELVADDICHAVSELPSNARLWSTLVAVLNRWRVFFDQHGLQGLSAAQQLGLYGELHLLHRHLEVSAGPQAALEAWHGPTGADCDFELKGVAIEVKTTSARGPLRVRITSERQLDDRGLDRLYLAIVTARLVPGGGESLPQLIQDIRTSMAANAGALADFEEKLTQTGYLDAHADQYPAGYHVQALSTFRVGPGFPRIIDRDLPTGVGDVSYVISLSGCADFQESIDEAIQAMVGNL